MLHRELLILQWFTASLFGAPNALNALNAPLKRQGCVNVAHGLCSKYAALISWSQVHRKALKGLVTAPLHHGAGVVARDFHPVSDGCVSKAVAGEAVCQPVVELGCLSGDATGPRYRVVIGRCRSPCKQVTVARETFADAGLHNFRDTAPQWYVALVLRLVASRRTMPLLQ